MLLFTVFLDKRDGSKNQEARDWRHREESRGIMKKASTSSIALAWKVSLGTVLGDIQQC